jgi:uncharacterized protein YjiS (DUF1127 family)
MSEQSCARALMPFSQAPAFDENNWRGAATAALDHANAWARAAAARFRPQPRRPRRPQVHRASMALAGLNDHTLADIGIHRSQIPVLARRVAEHPDIDPRGGGS